MQYVLISSCLLGNPVRYDGRGVPNGDAVLARWLAEGRATGPKRGIIDHQARTPARRLTPDA